MRVRCAAVAAPTQQKLIALDFDGVVCDSVGESSLSAFKVHTSSWRCVRVSGCTRPSEPSARAQLGALHAVAAALTQ